MTKERSPTGTNGVTDPLVTDTYREIATERTPASINESLLRQARAHAGSAYAHSLLWLRPMAWAATIGLCLAIVVELSDVPQPEAVDFEYRSSEFEAPSRPAEALAVPSRDDRTDRETDGRRSGEVSVLQQFNGSPPIAIPAENRTLGQDEIPALVIEHDGEAKTTSRAAANPSTSSTVPVEERKAAADADAFRVTDAPILEEAADMARMREGPNREIESRTADSTAPGSVAVSGYALSAEVMDDTAKPECDAEARSEPKSWLECIERLQKAGLDTQADEERSAFAGAFPNIDIP